MKTVRVYACRQFDVVTKKWTRSRFRYSLEQIASFPRAEPIMDDWADVALPDADDIDRNLTGSLMRGR